MSSRCTVCRHPQRDSIDVSVLRDGTRFTARQFQVSRPSLDRHKKHISHSAAADQNREVRPSNDDRATPLVIDVLIRHCESAIAQAHANRNPAGIMRAIKELRGCFELKCKLQAAEDRKYVPPVSEGQQQKHTIRDEESCIQRLDLLYWRTRGFNSLKIWQLRAMHEKVAKLLQAKLPSKEIAGRLALREVDGIGGPDVAFDERLYGILRYEEWKGREEEVGRAIAQHVREGLRGYPGILQHLDAAYIKSIGE